MSLNTLYGINGVGKDTVALEIQRRFVKDLTITSMSRLCMYLLGIAGSYDSQHQVDTTAYKRLESVPQPEMVELEEGPYRQFVEEVALSSDKVLMLSHLVLALHVEKDSVTYLTDRHVPEWYVKSNDSLVQLQAPSAEIMKRREHDALKSSGIRERPLILDQIKEHQALCDEEWDRIARFQAHLPNGMHVVANVDLGKAAGRVSEIFYD